MHTLFDSDQHWHGKIWSDGWTSAAGGHADVIEPANGAALAATGIGNADDIDRAVTSAATAQPAWAAITFSERARILREAARLMQLHAEEFNRWNVRECGSTTAKAQWELAQCCEQLHMAAALPMQPDGLLFPSSLPGRSNQWRQIPIGVVGVISPWNFPLLLSLRSVAPALALGNAVVLKPDTQSAVCGGLLLARLFELAGLPQGVLHVIPGGPAAGQALVAHAQVGMIAFTGSTAVGRAIGQHCGQSLKKVALELGGNNAQVVLADADLDAAASNGAWASFLHQGQICMQAGRHLVHRSVAALYAEKLAARAKALHVGDPYRGQVHLGPLINARQRDRLHGLVTQSIAAGATLLAGGHYDELFYAPTVLAGVTPEMPVYHEELFGPVAPITVFDDERQAIALVNGSPYGLAAAVHSRDVARATALGRQLRCGMVHINDQTVNNEFQVPFGGMGDSGNASRFGGPASVHEFTQSQWISIMDQPIQYPF
ncbi:benzaldehyde dehydrogenase [Herbaspirillum sp. WGmk3]|uniref:benzaldehyde dehydrogenase n=1 Tax=Herbaspirillum sp. WGmk3 TaxID=2919925 RepID=UPI002090EA51|nr:benzaldehyde dehydrogenase [Herbaspirillum sp. WGmk3]MCO4858382.1 benzaldehyde dehydrogenase [Herbaspirillum sp. WGmk3]